MRFTRLLPLLLACGFAPAVLAQPADNQVRQVATADTSAKADSASAPSPPQAQSQGENPEAAAALAMAIRQREAEERRIARIACAAGDASKCEAAKAPPAAGPSS